MRKGIIDKVVSGLSDKNIRFEELENFLPHWALASALKAITTAIKNAQAIIIEWIETAKGLGREIPAPKGKLMYA